VCVYVYAYVYVHVHICVYICMCTPLRLRGMHTIRTCSRDDHDVFVALHICVCLCMYAYLYRLILTHMHAPFRLLVMFLLTAEGTSTDKQREWCEGRRGRRGGKVTSDMIRT